MRPPIRRRRDARHGVAAGPTVCSSYRQELGSVQARPMAGKAPGRRSDIRRSTALIGLRDRATGSGEAGTGAGPGPATPGPTPLTRRTPNRARLGCGTPPEHHPPDRVAPPACRDSCRGYARTWATAPVRSRDARPPITLVRALGCPDHSGFRPASDTSQGRRWSLDFRVR